MGLLIDIKKTKESAEEVLYSFSTPEGDVGEVGINKYTGECSVIKEPEWDKESELASRVFRVLSRHWREGKFPDITCWAS